MSNFEGQAEGEDHSLCRCLFLVLKNSSVVGEEDWSAETDLHIARIWLFL